MTAQQTETEQTATSEKTDGRNSNCGQQSSKKCKFIAALIFIIIIVLLALAGFCYFHLARITKINSTLAQQIDEIHTQLNTRDNDIKTMREALNNVDAVVQKSQAISAQQEQLIKDWQAAQKGNLNKWRIAESAYLVRMANNQLKFMHNNQLAILLLGEAEAILQNLPNTETLRGALQENITQLKSQPKVDIVEIYLKLNALEKQVDELPLQSLPLKPDDSANASSNTTQNSQQIAAEPSWWQKGIHNTYSALMQLVVIRDTSKTPLPLMLPEEKQFLLQNLHSQFAMAEWGVLHQQSGVYAESLARIREWLGKYFDQTNATTQNMLKMINEMQQINIAPTIATDLSPTISLYDNDLLQQQAS